MSQETLKKILEAVLGADQDANPFDRIQREARETAVSVFAENYEGSGEYMTGYLSVMLFVAFMLDEMFIDQACENWRENPQSQRTEDHPQRLNRMFQSASEFHKAMMEMAEESKKRYEAAKATRSAGDETATSNEGDGRNVESVDSSEGSDSIKVNRKLH